MSQNVSNVNNNANTNKSVQQKRPAQITVKRGDSVSSLAKKYGMSKDDFMQWVGLKSTDIKIGQKLTIPMVEVPAGKGIIALAKEYGMTLDEFCKLNNINKNYQPAKGEKFYVKPKKASANTSEPTKPQVKTETGKEKPSVSTTTKPSNPATTKVQLSPIQQNQQKWGSSFTPKEIATKLKKEIGKWQRNSVGKQAFQDMLKQINPKNVQEVLKEYNKLSSKQTLINAITHEFSADKDPRKDAVMHIYDALAKAKGTPVENRAKFKEILDKEFDSSGMVDTKKLDNIINVMMNSRLTQASQSSQATGGSSAKTSSDKTKVKLKNGKEFTVAELHKSAISSARAEAENKFKQYCKENGIKYDPKLLDLSPMDRIPAPIVKGSSITSYNSGLLKPTVKPNGKVVILNPGHGGYGSKNGYFDVGAYSFIKKGNGKYAPLLEYEKMKSYAEKTAEALRAQGYAVVIAGSHVDTMVSDDLITNLISSLNNGKMGTKYDNKNISFISLHADSEPGQSGTGVCFDPGSATDVNFKNKLVSNLNQDDWISAKGSQRPNLHVIKKTSQIPSVLVEVEYVNGSKSKNLDSNGFQTRFINKLVSGLNEYYGIK